MRRARVELTDAQLATLEALAKHHNRMVQDEAAWVLTNALDAWEKRLPALLSILPRHKYKGTVVDVGGSEVRLIPPPQKKEKQ